MLNTITIHGRLTKQPELRRTQSGKAVTTITVAVDRMKKGEADFFDCVAFDKQAEAIATYLDKGRQVIVTGRMQSRRWEDKNGNSRLSWEIMVGSFDFCDSAKESKPSGVAVSGEDFADFEETEDDGELPF